jgi:DNA replicative helicase MCM subunit Mcm2 (Cdc46/Mcm family)
MVGGSTIVMDDGVKIRGNINIGLIGDPGIAKS